MSFPDIRSKEQREEEQWKKTAAKFVSSMTLITIVKWCEGFNVQEQQTDKAAVLLVALLEAYIRHVWGEDNLKERVRTYGRVALEMAKKKGWLKANPNTLLGQMLEARINTGNQLMMDFYGHTFRMVMLGTKDIASIAGRVTALIDDLISRVRKDIASD